MWEEYFGRCGNGLESNTVVILAADHGEALGDHGMWGKGPYHFDGVIRVPFLVSWPGFCNAGATHAGVVSLLDFAPTILDVAGVPIPEGERPTQPVGGFEPPPWPGQSLKPILTGTALVEDDQDDLGLRLRTLVTERYRLTVYAGQTYGELFDLQADPNELHNRRHDPSSSVLRDELRCALLDKIIATDHVLPRRMGSS